MTKRNPYPNKSSLARRSRDAINGTIGPGNPVILPSGVTTVKRKRKQHKPFSEPLPHQHWQRDKTREYGDVAANPVLPEHVPHGTNKPQYHYWISKAPQQRKRPGKDKTFETKAKLGNLSVASSARCVSDGLWALDQEAIRAYRRSKA